MVYCFAHLHFSVGRNSDALNRLKPIKSLGIRLSSGFQDLWLLFKLAKFGLILVVLTQLSIPSCIDNQHLFHSLFFVSHIFSTNPSTIAILSLLCLVPVACRFVYYSENNHLIVCMSTYGNYNLQPIFLQEKVLWY